MYQDVAQGISRGLAATYHVPTETPAHSQCLVARLRPSSVSNDAAKSNIRQSVGRELDRYIERLGSHLPRWFCEGVKWLRAPQGRSYPCF